MATALPPVQLAHSSKLSLESRGFKRIKKKCCSGHCICDFPPSWVSKREQGLVVFLSDVTAARHKVRRTNASSLLRAPPTATILYAEFSCIELETCPNGENGEPCGLGERRTLSVQFRRDSVSTLRAYATELVLYFVLFSTARPGANSCMVDMHMGRQQASVLSLYRSWTGNPLHICTHTQKKLMKLESSALTWKVLKLHVYKFPAASNYREKPMQVFSGIRSQSFMSFFRWSRVAVMLSAASSPKSFFYAYLSRVRSHDAVHMKCTCDIRLTTPGLACFRVSIWMILMWDRK